MGAGTINRARAGSGRSRRAPRRAMSEINVTPFVDVMLVLLIIFMVTAPMMVPGVQVDVPDSAAGALPSEDEQPLTVVLQADGTVSIQSTEIDVNELIPKLRAIAAERSSDKVFLRADGSITYESVMQVMGALSAGGFSNIGLVTESGGPTLTGEGE